MLKNTFGILGSIDGVEAAKQHFPLSRYRYMCELKRALDAKGNGVLEMPTGTGRKRDLAYDIATSDLGLDPTSHFMLAISCN